MGIGRWSWVALATGIQAASPGAARAGSELDDDTRRRHERASAPSSDDNEYERDDDDDRDDFFHEVYGEPFFAPSEPAFRAEATLATALHFERMASTAGGTIQHQDGLGFGFALDIVVFDGQARLDGRTGLAVQVSYGHAWLLLGHRPQGAAYTTSLSLGMIEVDVGPRWVHRGLGLELTWGLGLGATVIGAHEQFSDGLELDEILASGARMRPYLAIAPTVGVNESRPFAELGVALFAGSVTKHLDEYDSLVAGLSPTMATPYLRLGYLFAIVPGAWLGTNYETEIVGTRIVDSSWSHRVQLVLRLFDEGQLK